MSGVLQWYQYDGSATAPHYGTLCRSFFVLQRRCQALAITEHPRTPFGSRLGALSSWQEPKTQNTRPNHGNYPQPRALSLEPTRIQMLMMCIRPLRCRAHAFQCLAPQELLKARSSRLEAVASSLKPPASSDKRKGV